MVPIQYKDVKEGLYLLTEEGKIYSNYLNDFLSLSYDKDGYLRTRLMSSQKNKKVDVRIATLVALHFLGSPSKDLKEPTVNHIDGDKTNNHYSNLEWIERGHNSSIRFNKGDCENNSQAKLSNDQVVEICDLLINTEKSYQEIADLFGVKKSTISNIYNKKTWKKIVENYDFSCRNTIRDSSGQYIVYNINCHKED